MLCSSLWLVPSPARRISMPPSGPSGETDRDTLRSALSKSLINSVNSNGDSFSTLLNSDHLRYLAEPASVPCHVEVVCAIVVIRGQLVESRKLIFIKLLTGLSDVNERLYIECTHLRARKISL